MSVSTKNITCTMNTQSETAEGEDLATSLFGESLCKAFGSTDLVDELFDHLVEFTKDNNAIRDWRGEDRGGAAA